MSSLEFIAQSVKHEAPGTVLFAFQKQQVIDSSTSNRVAFRLRRDIIVMLYCLWLCDVSRQMLTSLRYIQMVALAKTGHHSSPHSNISTQQQALVRNTEHVRQYQLIMFRKPNTSRRIANSHGLGSCR
jgi:hypothetical protein